MYSSRSWRPLGVTPVRIAVRKSSNVQPRSSPAGVRLRAGGSLGGVPGIGPPEKLGPWHRLHSPARYSPYSAVAPRAGAGGRGAS